MNANLIALEKSPEYWYEGFPVGTGRLADLILSYPESDRVHLNHEALWTKTAKEATCSDFSGYLPELRRLIREHKNNEAVEFVVEHLQTLNATKWPCVDPYVPAGEIEFHYTVPEKNASFQRTLDLLSGCAECQTPLLKRSFWGNPWNDLLEGITVSETPVSAEMTLTRCCTDEKAGDSRPVFTFANGLMKLTGSVPGDVFYCIVCRIACDAGKVTETGNGLRIENFRKLAFRCNIGCGDSPEEAESEASLPVFNLDSFEKDKVSRDSKYRENYSKLASVELGTDDEVIRYFNMAKHLLLNAMQTGSYPLNLQGKWNPDGVPMWDCDYHFDINVQMCHWPLLPFGMEHENASFLKFFERIIPNAHEGARLMFGCRGLCLPFANSPLFRLFSFKTGGIFIGLIPWLSAHFFQHYLYTQDKTFLRDHIFPFLYETILFFEDFITYREDGTACISPSISPENRYIGAEKYPCTLCENPTMDVELVGELLDNGITASEILGRDPEERIRWKKMRDALPPLKIGKDGRLLEWEEEHEEFEPGHRHFSHLYGVWPGSCITQEHTPELFAAAKKSMDFRLRSFEWLPGWSRAWCANFKAMFRNGNDTLDELKTLVKDYSSVSLLDLHPAWREGEPFVFQIEGNMGAASAVFNMLLQNTPEYGVRLLPALPDAWAPEGRVSNLHAYGALVFSFAWKNGRITELTIKAESECTLHLTYQGKAYDLPLHPGINTLDCSIFAD